MHQRFSGQLLIFFTTILLSLMAQARDGKLLRSELWQPFDAESANGDFFVSPHGNDSWSGTLPDPNPAGTDGPFATLARAQQAVRELKDKVYLPKGKPIDVRYVGTAYPFGKGKDIVVFIRQGFYSLTEPLIFTPEDGGERVETNLPSGAFEWHHLRDNYVTWAAYPGEKPVISGAVPVNHWKKRGRVWVAPLKLKDAPVLVANGQKQTLARTPNTGYFTLRKTPGSTSEIPFKPGEIQAWPEMQDNRIVILLRWRSAYNSIARIDDKSQIAFLKTPEDGPGGHNGLLVVPPRYYVENVKTLLDYPGEWFFDKTKQEIYYIPQKGVADPNSIDLSVPQITRLVQVIGDVAQPVRNLRFYGLIFEGAKENFRDYPHHYDPTPDCVALAFENAHNCELGQSELRACSGVGLTIGAGCYGTRIVENRFDGLEQGALHVSSTGDMQNGKLGQVTRETLIDHNIFSNCGHGGGITLAAFGALRTTISRNYFTKSGRPYTIDCGGGGLEGNMSGDFVIEANHFEDVQIDADDAGVIVVNGMTFNSVVRNNLIHRVHRGFFSDNVAFWFDNMSSGWTVKNNIYYDIEQADMKTCGTYLSDNHYTDNFHIESPQNAPEQFLDQAPEFASSNLHLLVNGKPAPDFLAAGSVVKITADIFNHGGSGVAPVKLLINRQEVASQPFPVIRHNTRAVEFEWRLNEAGQQEISINETEPQIVTVQGEKPVIVCDQIQLSEDRILAGEIVRVSAVATNLQPTAIQSTLDLNLDGKPAVSQAIELAPQSHREIAFDLSPEAGDYVISIGNSAEIRLTVLRSQTLDLKKLPLQTYISPKARPAQVAILPEEDRYTIKASGWDFYRAEDAYATVYLKQLKGDFVATAKIAAFGERTNQWFRSGLFVRNDIRRSFDVERGSQGSVLMFSTPGRAGIQYDEFGDGCMHKAASENLPEDTPTPIWVRLERHGDRFTGYISLDGKNWMIKRQTKAIPGLAAAVDLGLAAGSPDQKQYTVEFTDWVVKVEANGN